MWSWTWTFGLSDLPIRGMYGRNIRTCRKEYERVEGRSLTYIYHIVLDSQKVKIGQETDYGGLEYCFIQVLSYQKNKWKCFNTKAQPPKLSILKSGHIDKSIFFRVYQHHLSLSNDPDRQKCTDKNPTVVIILTTCCTGKFKFQCLRFEWRNNREGNSSEGGVPFQCRPKVKHVAVINTMLPSIPSSGLA